MIWPLYIMNHHVVLAGALRGLMSASLDSYQIVLGSSCPSDTSTWASPAVRQSVVPSNFHVGLSAMLRCNETRDFVLGAASIMVRVRPRD